MSNYSKLKNKNILVCISGGIAVYKVVSLVNYFLKNNAQVKVIMTQAATEFVKPLTFESLINDNVYCNMWDKSTDKSIEHISLAKWADIVVLAPATANTISKIAMGIADNLLTTVIMALPRKKKIVIAPAMNTEMWLNPIVQNNINILKKYKGKYYFIEPRSGLLACGDNGPGKLADNKDILDFVIKLL